MILRFRLLENNKLVLLVQRNILLIVHVIKTYFFFVFFFQILVLDEADRCLDLGFEVTMNSIIENLPPKRQTLLFSATQTK